MSSVTIAHEHHDQADDEVADGEVSRAEAELGDARGDAEVDEQLPGVGVGKMPVIGCTKLTAES